MTDLLDFSASNNVLVINEREITEFGETAIPYTNDPIDPKAALRRGQGGRAVKLRRSNPGRTVSIFLNPGSADSAFMQGLFESGATIRLGRTQIGTVETETGLEGVIVNDGQTGRAGSLTITDDVFIIEFNIWTATKGS